MLSWQSSGYLVTDWVDLAARWIVGIMCGVAAAPFVILTLNLAPCGDMPETTSATGLLYALLLVAYFLMMIWALHIRFFLTLQGRLELAEARERHAALCPLPPGRHHDLPARSWY